MGFAVEYAVQTRCQQPMDGRVAEASIIKQTADQRSRRRYNRRQFESRTRQAGIRRVNMGKCQWWNGSSNRRSVRPSGEEKRRKSGMAVAKE